MNKAQSELNNKLASDLAALGYPGFSHIKPGRAKGPAEVLISALKSANLDARVTEALPWLLYTYHDLDWECLVREALLNELQNKLGFLTNVTRRLAEESGAVEIARLLRRCEAILDKSRLEREETFCHESLTQVERNWLRLNRPKEAEHWHLLTDLSPDHLSSFPRNLERDTIASRAKRANLKTFDEILARVPDVRADPTDEI